MVSLWGFLPNYKWVGLYEAVDVLTPDQEGAEMGTLKLPVPNQIPPGKSRYIYMYVAKSYIS